MSKAIPELKSIGDVSRVSLKDNGEEMVSLNGVQPDKLVVFSKSFKEGKKGSIEDVSVRKAVKEMLIKAAENLPKEYKLVVWETYTPKSLIEANKGEVLSDFSGFSHNTGGAVDVSLADENGNLLEMGTDLNHGSPENKSTLYFEEKDESVLSDSDKVIKEHRRILFHAMSEAGFTNNPLAWFHWDYGNVWWASLTGKDAFYGPLD